MTFDNLGNLFPYEIIKTDLTTFEQLFVANFPLSETRRMIFENYRQMIDDFKSQIGDSFYQWIGGSFVSTKNNPHDIDVVTFLDHQIYDIQSQALRRISGYQLYKEKQLDSCIVKLYPVEHVQYESITKPDTLE
ncbi:DUF6932 family protein [Runella slithyformis]|uniref:DUF6932 family protein n=1 Tax=Runella slithyformis TaxID=106 RepID=UPI00146CE53E|nr:hypothetical protein [Runella slithyformis]